MRLSAKMLALASCLLLLDACDAGLENGRTAELETELERLENEIGRLEYRIYQLENYAAGPSADGQGSANAE